jgi:hypothetical protein
VEEALSTIVRALLDIGQREKALKLVEVAQSDKLKQLADVRSDTPATADAQTAKTQPDGTNNSPRAAASQWKTLPTKNGREHTEGSNDDSTHPQLHKVKQLVSQGKLAQATDFAHAIPRNTSDFFNERGEALASGSVTQLVRTIADAVPEVLIDVARCTHSLSLYKQHG